MKQKYNEVKKWAEKFSKSLKSFNYIVYVHHKDGSFFNFCCADIYYNDDFLIVFTEHNGLHIFFKDDIIEFSGSQPGIGPNWLPLFEREKNE
jgi:hypothetical protein